MLESCLTPDLVVEITLQPVRRHGVDAAILFSDIVVPLKLAGIDLEIQPGVGPVIATPVRTCADADSLGTIEPLALEPITESVHRLVRELGFTPLIGFGGAPFTLASYLIEGGPSQKLPASRAMMRDQPELWDRVLNWCADITEVFIRAQVLAGASAIQIFDSWAGRLTAEEYREFALPYSTRLFGALADLNDRTGQPVPRVHFGVGTGHILTDMYSAGATVMGIGSDTKLSEADSILGGTVPLQGNIPVDVLVQPYSEIESVVRDVIEQGKSAPGHIVNLGHGVPKDTTPEVLTHIVRFVHENS